MGNKILAVDDDQDLLHLIATTLKSQNFEVETIANGREAIAYLSDQANAEKIGLLILDRMLPDMDGLDILKFVLEKYPNKIAVLILSALSSEKDTLEGLKRGAVDYMTKPFSINVLLQKAKQLINKT